MIEIEYYRVQQKWNRHGRGTAARLIDPDKLRRVPRKPWYRTWQAEWDGCQRAPRAWTRRGIERKATRWAAR